MNMDEYLDELKGQIRDRHAKEFVSDEIKNHIEEQADTYMSDGMSREDALTKAVKDMGDPVSVGIELDRIHRPHMEWRFLACVLLVSVLSIVVHYLINRGLDPQLLRSSDIPGGVSRSHLLSIIIGIVAMLLVYRADYTVLLGRSRVIAGVYLALITLLSIPFGYYVNGTNRWIGIGPISFSVHALLLLYLPLFGGILYECRGKARSAVFQIVFWMMAPIISRLIIGDRSAPFGLFILLAEAVLVFLAVMKNWYSVKKKAVLIGFGSALAAIFIFIGFTMHFNGYQRSRIETWLAHFGVGSCIQDSNGMNYIYARIGEVFSNSNLVGKSDSAVDIINELPGFRDDLIIGSISAYCGKLAVAGVIVCLCILAVYIFRISLRQKNSLGYIVGCACGIAIALQCVSNILIVFGVLPLTSSTLPIISRGASACIVDYMLLGMILSIYRYKDIRREKTAVNLTLRRVE